MGINFLFHRSRTRMLACEYTGYLGGWMISFYSIIMFIRRANILRLLPAKLLCKGIGGHIICLQGLLATMTSHRLLLQSFSGFSFLSNRLRGQGRSRQAGGRPSRSVGAQGEVSIRSNVLFGRFAIDANAFLGIIAEVRVESCQMRSV